MGDERIAGVAIRLTDRMAASMPSPARHGDLIKEMCLCGLDDYAHNEQGFVTNGGKYVDRQEAYAIAMTANQVLPSAQSLFPGRDLFSEDVW